MAASVSIRPAEPRDHEEILALHVEAFAEDPIVAGIASRAPEPQAAQVALIQYWLDPYLEGVDGAVCDVAIEQSEAGERILGVMTWNPEEGGIQGDGEGAADAAVDAAIEAATSTARDSKGSEAGGTGADGTIDSASGEPVDESEFEALFGDAVALMEEDHRVSEAAAPHEPHWYACMIVVSPQAQGKGVGSALMCHGLTRADHDGLPAHLESTTPDSRRLYERFGFRETAELHVDGLPTYWAMTRPAPQG